MHVVPEDGFDHDTSGVSMSCPCNPYLEPHQIFAGSSIMHREMRVPDFVPPDWINEDFQ